MTYRLSYIELCFKKTLSFIKTCVLCNTQAEGQLQLFKYWNMVLPLELCAFNLVRDHRYGDFELDKLFI